MPPAPKSPAFLRRLACALAAAWGLTVATLLLFAEPPGITGPATVAYGYGISNLKSEISDPAKARPAP